MRTLIAAALAAAPASAAIHDIHFVDRREGWAVADGGAIFHTIDSGRTWERQASGTTASLRGLDFTTAYTGWAVGRDGDTGVVLRTTNGGLSWRRIERGQVPGLNRVRFTNPVDGFAEGDGGRLATRDGGRTWRPTTAKPIGATRRAAEKAAGVATVCDVCSVGRHVWAVGSPGSVVWHSADGGESWDRRPTGVATPLRCVHFVTPLEGYAAGDLDVILTTADGGRSWKARKRTVERAAVMFACRDLPTARLEELTGEGYVTVATAGAAGCDGVVVGEPSLERAVLWLRTWRPTVVVADAESAALFTGAAAAAADATRFPDHMKRLKLAPWKITKLHADGKSRRGDIMAGVTLPRGGTARRRADSE